MNRLEVLNRRTERLLDMNRRHGFTSSDECDRYLRLLLEIHTEKVLLWQKNRADRLEIYNNAKQAVIGLIKREMI